MEIKKIVFFFITTLLLNFAWEYLHSFLYLNYRGGPITLFILLRATIFDAVFVTILYLLFASNRFLKERLWIILLVCFITAIIIEEYAFSTSRWIYASTMPIIPILNIGLTPAIQLLVTFYLSFNILKIWQQKK